MYGSSNTVYIFDKSSKARLPAENHGFLRSDILAVSLLKSLSPFSGNIQILPQRSFLLSYCSWCNIRRKVWLSKGVSRKLFFPKSEKHPCFSRPFAKVKSYGDLRGAHHTRLDQVCPLELRHGHIFVVF